MQQSDQIEIDGYTALQVANKVPTSQRSSQYNWKWSQGWKIGTWLMNVQSSTSQLCWIKCTDHCIVCWSPLLHRSPDAQRRVVTSQPTDSSQDSQTAKDSQNRDKEVFVPHSVTIRRLGKQKRIAILLDFVPKEHNTLLPPKCILDSLNNQKCNKSD